MKRKNSIWKTPLLLAAAFLLLLLTSCEKEENVTPRVEWQLEYSLSSIGVVDIEEITYVDENGVQQTIPGERDFRLSFKATSGFIAKLEVKGTATNGGVIAKIDAIALDGTFDNLIVSDDDGEAGGMPKNIRLSVNLLLP